MKTFRCKDDEGGRPWVAWSDNGTVLMFGTSPAAVAKWLQAGDQWAPNIEWGSAVAAGVVEAIEFPANTGAFWPQKIPNATEYDNALALIRRNRSVN